MVVLLVSRLGQFTIDDRSFRWRCARCAPLRGRRPAASSVDRLRLNSRRSRSIQAATALLTSSCAARRRPTARWARTFAIHRRGRGGHGRGMAARRWKDLPIAGDHAGRSVTRAPADGRVVVAAARRSTSSCRRSTGSIANGARRSWSRTGDRDARGPDPFPVERNGLGGRARRSPGEGPCIPSSRARLRDDAPARCRKASARSSCSAGGGALVEGGGRGERANAKVCRPCSAPRAWRTRRRSRAHRRARSWCYASSRRQGTKVSPALSSPASFVQRRGEAGHAHAAAA